MPQGKAELFETSSPLGAAIDRPPTAILIQPKSEIKDSGVNLPY
jgi:hypothetical protein